MSEQQRLAFEQLPGMTLVAARVEGRRGCLVRIDETLFVLSPSGLLRRYR